LAMVARWRAPCIKSWPQYQVGRCVSSPLFGKALVERTKIDDNSLVGSGLLYAVACRHVEVNSLSLDVDYLGRRAHLGLQAGGEVLCIIPRRPLGIVGVNHPREPLNLRFCPRRTLLGHKLQLNVRGPSLIIQITDIMRIFSAPGTIRTSDPQIS